MPQHAEATFEITGWDEKPYEEFTGGRKLTRAQVKKTFEGDITGESTLEYLMCYDTDGAATFVGLERLVGQIGDRKGSFVLQHSGTFTDGVADETWSVVPGSGTGRLTGLSGKGKGSFGKEPPHVFKLTYDLE